VNGLMPVIGWGVPFVAFFCFCFCAFVDCGGPSVAVFEFHRRSRYSG